MEVSLFLLYGNGRCLSLIHIWKRGAAGLQSEGRYLKRTRCLAGTWSKPWRIFSLMVFHRPQTLTTLICLAALMCLRTGAEKRARRPPGLDGPAGSAEIHPHEKNKIRRVFSAERPPAKIILAGGRWLSKFLTRIIFQRVCRFSDVRFGAAAESADSLAAPFPFGNWAVLSQSLVSFRMRPVQCSEPLVPRNESSPDKRLAAHPR